MANRIDSTFKRLARERRKALIGYITAGHPTLGSLKNIVPLLEEAGLDLLELGVPFSDPIADGPTIQHSSQIALNNGATLSWILKSVRELRARVKLPLVLMSYSNPIYSMGPKRFFEQAKQAGVDGVIIPDLIPEESGEFGRSARQTGVHLIYLAAPTTPKARLSRIARASRGFLYAVSVTGVTGARHTIQHDVSGFLKTVRKASRCPIAVGFGISSPEQARTLSAQADGVIVGSALIKQIESSKHKAFAGAARFIRSLRTAMDR